jgi:hypothetical protein
MDRTLLGAYKHSWANREEVQRSGRCGCFHCLELFQAAEVRGWTHNGTTALCPRCGTDAVIGDASGFTIEEQMLAQLREMWF